MKKRTKKSSDGKGNVDALFWKRIRKLLKHVFTSWTCKEAQYVYSLTILLVIRTFMSIWLADVNGRVVKAIVNKSFPEFLSRVSTTAFLYVSVDRNFIPIRHSELHSQFSPGLPPKKACSFIQKENHKLLPQLLPQVHALLQDLQP